jgi:hypothetical protein
MISIQSAEGLSEYFLRISSAEIWANSLTDSAAMANKKPKKLGLSCCRNARSRNYLLHVVDFAPSRRAFYLHLSAGIWQIGRMVFSPSAHIDTRCVKVYLC